MWFRQRSKQRDRNLGHDRAGPSEPVWGNFAYYLKFENEMKNTGTSMALLQASVNRRINLKMKWRTRLCKTWRWGSTGPRAFPVSSAVALLTKAQHVPKEKIRTRTYDWPALLLKENKEGSGWCFHVSWSRYVLENGVEPLNIFKVCSQQKIRAVRARARFWKKTSLAVGFNDNPFEHWQNTIWVGENHWNIQQKRLDQKFRRQRSPASVRWP